MFMRMKVMLDNIGKLFMMLALSMLIPLFVAWFYHEETMAVFLQLTVILLAAGLLLCLALRPTMQERRGRRLKLLIKDGYVLATLGWIIAAVVGMLPYLLTGTLDTVTDAFFESLSGFTTVGISVLADVEIAPKSILMWRSTTHWLGGMGIMVLFVAILSNMSNSVVQIFKTETVGAAKDKLHPKLVDSIFILWLLYLFNTAMTIILYFLAGMDLFAAVNHGFSLVSTGGFSTKNASIGGFNSMVVQWAVSISMYLVGINYALFFYLWRTKSLQCFLRSLELRVYTLVIVFASVLVTWHILPQYGYNLFLAGSDGIFQVLSMVTTVGWVTADYESWITPAKMVLVLLLFCGSCAGSTGSGMTIDRHIILWQQAVLEIQRFIHPRVVTVLKINHQVVRGETIHNVTTFFYMYMVLVGVGTCVVVGFGIDFLTAFSSVAATLGGIGPAMGIWGPVESFADAPAILKWMFCALMLLGRLEIYTVLVFLDPKFKKNQKSNRVVEGEY